MCACNNNILLCYVPDVEFLSLILFLVLFTTDRCIAKVKWIKCVSAQNKLMLCYSVSVQNCAHSISSY